MALPTELYGEISSWLPITSVEKLAKANKQTRNLRLTIQQCQEVPNIVIAKWLKRNAPHNQQNITVINFIDTHKCNMLTKYNGICNNNRRYRMILSWHHNRLFLSYFGTRYSLNETVDIIDIMNDYIIYFLPMMIPIWRRNGCESLIPDFIKELVQRQTDDLELSLSKMYRFLDEFSNITNTIITIPENWQHNKNEPSDDDDDDLFDELIDQIIDQWQQWRMYEPTTITDSIRQLQYY